MLIGCVGFHVSAYRPTTEIKQCMSVGRTAPELSVDAELRLISGRRRYSCKVTFSCTGGAGRSCHDVSLQHPAADWSDCLALIYVVAQAWPKNHNCLQVQAGHHLSLLVPGISNPIQSDRLFQKTRSIVIVNKDRQTTDNFTAVSLSYIWTHAQRASMLYFADVFYRFFCFFFNGSLSWPNGWTDLHETFTLGRY